MISITIARSVLGLLRLQGQRKNCVCELPGCTLVADPRWGMPDARDLLAMLLCSDAATKPIPRVSLTNWVSRESLMRVANVKFELGKAPTLLVPVASVWDADGFLLSPQFVARCTESPCVEVPLEPLLTLPRGALALAAALRTTTDSSIALPDVLTAIGSRNRNTASAWQQLLRWLGMLGRVVPDWTYDRFSKVLFRLAKRPLRRPVAIADPVRPGTQGEEKSWLPTARSNEAATRQTVESPDVPAARRTGEPAKSTPGPLPPFIRSTAKLRAKRHARPPKLSWCGRLRVDNPNSNPNDDPEPTEPPERIDTS